MVTRLPGFPDQFRSGIVYDVRRGPAVAAALADLVGMKRDSMRLAVHGMGDLRDETGRRSRCTLLVGHHGRNRRTAGSDDQPRSKAIGQATHNLVAVAHPYMRCQRLPGSPVSTDCRYLSGGHRPLGPYFDLGIAKCPAFSELATRPPSCSRPWSAYRSRYRERESPRANRPYPAHEGHPQSSVRLRRGTPARMIPRGIEFFRMRIAVDIEGINFAIDTEFANDGAPINWVYWAPKSRISIRWSWMLWDPCCPRSIY